MSENSKRPVSTDLTQNIEEMEFYFHDCADIKKKQMKLGRNQDTACYLTFIEVSVDMGTSALGETLKYLNGLTRDEILCTLQENALGISDATYFSTIEEAVSGLLTGEAILFVDGFDFLADAIDSTESKADLLIEAYRHNVPVVSAMGTGNKLHPEMLEITDISKTSVCPLARSMRKKLRDAGITEGITVVYSHEEPQRFIEGSVPGSLVFVPACAGMMMAAHIVQKIIAGQD